MKKVTKNLFSVFGVLSMVIAITTAIPFYLTSNYIGLGVSFIFVIIGAILLSIAFGD
jgi:hypothetical protein